MSPRKPNTPVLTDDATIEVEERAVRAGGPVEQARMWDGPRLRYLIVAYGFSWAVWIGTWVAAARGGTGNLLFNESLVWGMFFTSEASARLVGLSLLSMVGVYGPMIAGVLATRADPALPRGDLRARLLRARVGGRPYGAIALVLTLITLPTLVVTALTSDPAADAPSGGTLLVFLLGFFAVQVATSGTEEIGWRGYLTHTMLPGRSYWSTGWAVGLVWAVWHYPVVIQIFLSQGMVPAQVFGSLAGFSIGIVAMAILQTWFYQRTRSVFVAILIHAAFNTVPLTVTLLFEGSPAALLGNLLLWAVVLVVKSRTDHAAKFAEPVGAAAGAAP